MGAAAPAACHCNDGGGNLLGQFEDCGQTGLECGDSAKADHGIEELQDGSIYEGQFLGRERHGRGKMVWANGDIYEGHFNRSQMHGQGAMQWVHGVTYSGQWRHNELGPAGVMKWPDGRQFRGHFIEGEKHGEGRLMWPDGRSYTGQWCWGVQHGYGFVAERRGTPHLSHWDSGELMRWLPEAELAALPSVERAQAALASGAVRLLSAQWLLDRPEGFVLPRRRDLPVEAFVFAEDAETLLEKRYGIVVVSCSWLSVTHPDPHGFHTKSLVKYLTKHMDFFSGFEDVGVFWDYASLQQTPHTGDAAGTTTIASPRNESPREDADKLEELRAIGLEALPCLYGGKKTLVVKLTRMPEGSSQMPYDSRGWCFAESTLSGIVKQADQCLDLGLAAKALSDDGLPWEDFRDLAVAGRHPPLLPEDMAHAVDRLAVTQGNDRVLICKMYASFFAEVAGSTVFLGLANSRPESGGWGDTEMKLLCRALPSFTSCKALSLANHGSLSKTGLKSLRERLPQLPQLRRLVLPQHLQESREAHALQKEWSAAGKTPEHLVWLRRLGDAGHQGRRTSW
uniref:Uncharacterized protein n=1 Tax=Alexandrium monilatum TaxID=311494 RepID=A0A6T0UMJ3_9DINO